MKSPPPIVIAGAGCAGLSLAVALAARERHRDIVVIDPRTTFGRDRTWCAWNVAPHDFSDAVSQRWHAWEVVHRGVPVVRRAAKLVYELISSERFYEVALERLSRAPNVTMRLGETVTAIDDADGARTAVVYTSTGTLDASHVYDGRPAPLPASVAQEHTRLWQRFRGFELEVDADVFTPGRATLMDFDVSEEHTLSGVHFIYVLPSSPRRALVEPTWFVADLDAELPAEAATRAYLQRRFGLSTYRVLHEEHGVLPMTSEPFSRSPSPRVTRIGLAGGFAKPSTGYAFLPIQRFAQDVSILGLPRALARAHSPRHAYLDRVFLRFLRDDPTYAPRLFTDLFARTPAASLVRFLNELSDLRDDAAVIAACPRLRMTRTAIGDARRWLLA